MTQSQTTETQHHVRFIEFVRPNGKQKEQTILRGKDTFDKSEWLWEHGYRLTAELIPGNLVSLIVDHPASQRDVVLGLIKNGPEIEEAVDKLVKDAYEKENEDA